MNQQGSNGAFNGGRGAKEGSSFRVAIRFSSQFQFLFQIKVLVFNSILNSKLFKANFNCSVYFPNFNFGCPVSIVLGFLSRLIKIAIQFARFESNFSGFCFALFHVPLLVSCSSTLYPNSWNSYH